MADRLSEVRSPVTLRLVFPRADVMLDASLRYDRDDPYAVHLVFPTWPGRDPIEWIFARSLVSDGLTVPAGDGDVRIWPSPEDLSGPVYVELCPPSGRALFALPRPVLADFVARCHGLVAPGAESAHLHLDAELDLLLYDGLN